MTERLRESLSALMDDEADDLELGRVLRAMDEDDVSVRQTWARYQMVSAVMRGLPVGAADSGYADPVVHASTLDAMDPAEATAAQAAGAASSGSHRVRPWLSFATAAGVTLMAVVGVQWQSDDEAPAPARVATTASAASTPTVADLGGFLKVSSPGAGQQRVRTPVPLRYPAFARPPQGEMSDARRQVDAYMLYHAEMSALNSRAGMVPFARYAAFEGTQPVQ